MLTERMGGKAAGWSPGGLGSLPLLGPPASLVTAGPKARSPRGLRVCAPRVPSPPPAPPGAEGRKLHRQARALPPSPAIPVRDAVPVRHHARPGFAKRPPRASPTRAVPGAKATASPGLSPADSRCTPSASRLACRASVAKFRSRPVSSGFLPSLTFALGRALGDGRRGGDEAAASAGPRGDAAGRVFSAGAQSAAAAAILRLGSEPAGFGKPGGGEVPWAAAAAPHPPPGAVSRSRAAARSPRHKYGGDY